MEKLLAGGKKEVPEHQPKQYVSLYMALLGSYLKEM